MAIRGKECVGCGHRYEVFVMGPTRSFVIDQAAAYKGQLVCPACGGAKAHGMIPPRVEIRGSSSMGSRAQTYPYYDHGLGCWLNSPAHRLETAKRLGFTPTEGESIGTWGDIAEKDASKAARDQAKYDAYVDEMETTAGAEWNALKDHLKRDVAAKAGQQVEGNKDRVAVVGD